MFRDYFSSEEKNKKHQGKVNNNSSSSLRMFDCCHATDPLCSLGDVWGGSSPTDRRSRRSRRSYDVETVGEDESHSYDSYSYDNSEEESKLVDCVDDSMDAAIQRQRRNDHSLTEKFISQTNPARSRTTRASSLTISTAPTAVIENTTTLRNAANAAAIRVAAAAQQQQQTHNSKDEAQRALDWIQDPLSTKGILKADSTVSSNSILATVPPPQTATIATAQEQTAEPEIQTKEIASPTPAPAAAAVEYVEEDPAAFSYWKKLDEKVKAQKQDLQSKQKQESQSLQQKKEEQANLAHSRLENMFPMFVAATGPPVAIEMNEDSDIEVEQKELETEHARELQQKEAELEIFQSAVHKRLKRSSKPLPKIAETITTTTRLERKLEGDKWTQKLHALPPLLERMLEEEGSKSTKSQSIQEEVDEHDEEETAVVSAVTEPLQQESSLSGRQEAERPVHVDESRVPPLPRSLDAGLPPRAESSEEHKQHLLESPDRANEFSLRPNQRLRPIQCKIELPKKSPKDEAKELRMAEEKRLRDEFKAARLKALVEQQQSDDLSTATPSSAKTTATSQTTQTTQTSTSSTSLPPTIMQLPARRRRGESAKLAAKRKELEWKWNSSKKPVEQVEQEQLTKAMNPTRKLSQRQQPQQSQQPQQQDGKWLMDYKPGMEEAPQTSTPPPKVWSKTKVGAVSPTTMTTTPITTTTDNVETPPKSRVSELVARQRALHERIQNRKSMQAKWENRQESAKPAVVAQVPSTPTMSVEQQVEEEKASTVASTTITPDRETASQVKLRFSGYLEQQQTMKEEKVAVVTPEPAIVSTPRVTGFWQHKVSNEESKQKRKEMQEKWNAGVQGKASPSQEEEVKKPLSRIEAKRKELAEKRKAFEKQKAEVSKRQAQELMGYEADTLLEEENEKVNTKQLVGRFEGLGTNKKTGSNHTKAVSSAPSDGCGPVRKLAPSRQMADWKQKELDRRNTEYLSKVGRTESREVASSVAWPDLVNPTPTTHPLATPIADGARSDHSVPEKDITRKQQLRQAWRHRAWKAIDKVDHVAKDRQSQQLGTAAVQLVLGNSAQQAVMAEQS